MLSSRAARLQPVQLWLHPGCSFLQARLREANERRQQEERERLEREAAERAAFDEARARAAEEERQRREARCVGLSRGRCELRQPSLHQSRSEHAITRNAFLHS